jgi:hypothetical protein
MEYGILGLVILVLDIWAILGVWGSSASLVSKLLWTALIVILPVVGLIIWYFAGPKGSARAV